MSTVAKAGLDSKHAAADMRTRKVLYGAKNFVSKTATHAHSQAGYHLMALLVAIALVLWTLSCDFGSPSPAPATTNAQVR